jgi:hypothetical protein
MVEMIKVGDMVGMVDLSTSSSRTACALNPFKKTHRHTGLTDGDDLAGPGIAEGSGATGPLRTIAPAARAAGALAHQGIETLLHPRHARSLAAAAAADAQTLAKLLLPTADPDSTIKGEQHVAHRVAWSDPVDLWRVKRAGRAHAATVNDVLVAAVAGAVGGHLCEHGEDIETVHALVPFNLRPLDQPLPHELGNRFDLVLLGLPLGIAARGRRRRVATKSTTGAHCRAGIVLTACRPT